MFLRQFSRAAKLSSEMASDSHHADTHTLARRHVGTQTLTGQGKGEKPKTTKTVKEKRRKKRDREESRNKDCCENCDANRDECGTGKGWVCIRMKIIRKS